jgi:hypothetical protein
MKSNGLMLFGIRSIAVKDLNRFMPRLDRNTPRSGIRSDQRVITDRLIY